MLKQGVKTINADVIQTRALSQLSFIKFTPDANSFPGLLLSLTLMLKSKKTLETSLYRTLSVILSLTSPGGRLSLLPNFQKRGGLNRISIFRDGLLGKRGVTGDFFQGGGCSFYIKVK